MSKYKKQFIVKTEDFIKKEYPMATIEDIREAYNPDMLDNMNRTYAHITKENGSLTLLVLDWNDKFNLTNKKEFN